MNFYTQPLFGGAITCKLPYGFFDASKIRDVPDHQEVFMDAEKTEQSVIIEIVDYEPTVPAEDCGRFFFKDYVEACETAEYNVIESRYERVNDPAGLIAGQALVAGVMRASKIGTGKRREVTVCMSVFRMPSVKSEIMVIFNWPEGPIQHASAIHRSISESFKVLDKGLFC